MNHKEKKNNATRKSIQLDQTMTTFFEAKYCGSLSIDPLSCFIAANALQEWIDGRTYYKGEKVLQNEITYEVLVEKTTSPPSSITSWRAVQEWNASVTYSKGSVVIYKNKRYVSLLQTTDEQPDLNANSWKFEGVDYLGPVSGIKEVTQSTFFGNYSIEAPLPEEGMATFFAFLKKDQQTHYTDSFKSMTPLERLNNLPPTIRNPSNSGDKRSLYLLQMDYWYKKALQLLNKPLDDMVYDFQTINDYVPATSRFKYQYVMASIVKGIQKAREVYDALEIAYNALLETTSANNDDTLEEMSNVLTQMNAYLYPLFNHLRYVDFYADYPTDVPANEFLQPHFQTYGLSAQLNSHDVEPLANMINQYYRHFLYEVKSVREEMNALESTLKNVFLDPLQGFLSAHVSSTDSTTSDSESSFDNNVRISIAELTADTAPEDDVNKADLYNQFQILKNELGQRLYNPENFSSELDLPLYTLMIKMGELLSPVRVLLHFDDSKIQCLYYKLILYFSTYDFLNLAQQQTWITDEGAINVTDANTPATEKEKLTLLLEQMKALKHYTVQNLCRECNINNLITSENLIQINNVDYSLTEIHENLTAVLETIFSKTSLIESKQIQDLIDAFNPQNTVLNSNPTPKLFNLSFVSLENTVPPPAEPDNNSNNNVDSDTDTTAGNANSETGGGISWWLILIIVVGSLLVVSFGWYVLRGGRSVSKRDVLSRKA